MRANLRLRTMLVAAGLWLAQPAIAQSVPDTTTNSPASDGVGPAELRGFSLPGTVTRPTDQPTATAPAKPASTAPDNAASQATPTAAERKLRTATSSSNVAAVRAAPRSTQAQPTVPEASLAAAPSLPVTTEPSPALPRPTPAPSSPLAVPAQRNVPVLPWIAAAFALVLAGGFLLFLRSRRRESYAGPEFDLFTAPQPETIPASAPPRRTPPPSPPEKPVSRPTGGGIVASRLRPSLEIAVQPLRCHSDAEKVVLEFELELFNSGTVPARAVLAEASLLNAGAAQDEQLAAFFANPVGQGQPVDSIPPLKSMKFTSQVIAPRASIQEYELAGRKAFVPVIAFNALYRWSGGDAQTSVAYLVGRDTRSDKLGPLRLDGEQAEFRRLAAKLLPAGLRT